MGQQRVLWMLVLTFSTCWKAQVNIAGESPTSWLSQDVALSYKEAVMETPHCPLPFSTDEGEPKPSLMSTGEYGKKICASETTLTGSAGAVNGAVDIVPREEGRQRKSLKIQELQNSERVWILSTEAASLAHMLAAVVQEQLRDCDLVLAYDTGYSANTVFQYLLPLHNPRQVVHIKTIEDLTRIIWTSSKCRGYFFLVDKPEPLLTFARTYPDTWDYSGRFVLVVPSLQYLEAFLESDIGERTEHVVGVVKSGTEGEWLLYMNKLYWGPGVRRVNSWYHHRFSRKVDLFPDKLSDLRGAVLRVSTFQYPPVIFYHRAVNGTVLFRYGFDIEVVKAVALALNFTIDFREPPNGETWGENLGNGAWTGFTGQLLRHEIDIGFCTFLVSKYYTPPIEYTTPYTSETMCFLTRMEPPLPHWQALAFPFHKWTWLAVVVGLMVSGPLLFLLARCSDLLGGELKILQSLSFSWYYAFGLHFCEAQASLPRTTSTQIFVMFLWLYTMILTIVYSTNLMSFLLVKKQPAMMETIQDLYESGLEVAVLGTMFRDGLAMSSNPYLKALVKVYKRYETQEQVMEQVLQGKAVYLGNRVNAEYLDKIRYNTRGVSRVRIMKETFQTYSVALGVQHHSPLKRKLDQLAGWVEQSGLVRKFFLDSLQLSISLEKDGTGGEDSASGQDDTGGEVSASDQDGIGGEDSASDQDDTGVEDRASDQDDTGGDDSASDQDDTGGEDSASGQDAGSDGVIPLSLDHMQGLFLITCFGLLSSVLSFILEKTIFSD